MTDAEHARERIAYDPATGRMVWKMKPSRCVNAGDETGVASGGGHGYGRVKLFGKQHQAHRVAWLITYDVWPSEDLDHINGIRSDNRIANLREASRAMNAENRHGPQRFSKSGILGVSVQDGKYKARIVINRQYVYLGFFDTAEEASAAYLAAKREHHAGCTI